MWNPFHRRFLPLLLLLSIYWIHSSSVVGHNHQ
jgi:hypothetical protein